MILLPFLKISSHIKLRKCLLALASRASDPCVDICFLFKLYVFVQQKYVKQICLSDNSFQQMFVKKDYFAVHKARFGNIHTILVITLSLLA